MGIFEHLFSGGAGQHCRRTDALAERLAGQRRRLIEQTTASDRRAAALRARVDELELLCRALAQELIARGALSAEQLADRIHAIDAADGAADGRIERPAPAPVVRRRPRP